jgi:hypothetical protein
MSVIDLLKIAMLLTLGGGITLMLALIALIVIKLFEK